MDGPTQRTLVLQCLQRHGRYSRPFAAPLPSLPERPPMLWAPVCPMGRHRHQAPGGGILDDESTRNGMSPVLSANEAERLIAGNLPPIDRHGEVVEHVGRDSILADVGGRARTLRTHHVDVSRRDAAIDRRGSSGIRPSACERTPPLWGSLVDLGRDWPGRAGSELPRRHAAPLAVRAQSPCAEDNGARQSSRDRRWI